MQQSLVFEKLWNLVDQRFADQHFKPRNIHRHKIIQTIFGNRQFWRALKEGTNEEIQVGYSHCDEYYRSPAYFKDRAVIETILEAHKLDGQISIDYLLSSKAGFYFSKYYFQSTLLDSNQTNILSFIEFLEYIGAKVDYVNNVCKMPDIFDKQDIAHSTILSPQTKNQILATHDVLTNLMTEYKKSRKSVISIDYQSRYYLSYNKYATHQLITTNLSLEFELLKRFRKHWTHVLIVEDSGLTFDLYGEYIRTNVETLTVILADRSKYYGNDELSEWLKDEYQPCLVKPLLFMESDLHDHHMTIFANVHTNKMESIYYLQKGLSNTFSPIAISEKKNLKTLLQIFEKYFVSAANFTGLQQYDYGKNEFQEILNNISVSQ